MSEPAPQQTIAERIFDKCQANCPVWHIGYPNISFEIRVMPFMAPFEGGFVRPDDISIPLSEPAGP